MELSPEQIAAARASGCAFSPATEDQVRRLTMQRRVFRVDGRPFLATRDGGYFETHATLAALIEGHRPVAAESRVAADAAPGPEHTVRSGAEPPPAPAESEVARAERNQRDAAAPKPRKPRAPRLERAPADTDAALGAEAAAEPSEAEGMLAGVAAAQGGGVKARVVGRGRRAGQPPTPRWMVAGKMRRGRLK